MPDRSGIMFHFAARARRDEIAEHGLTPTTGCFRDNPDGVYLWEQDPRTFLGGFASVFDPAQGDLYTVEVDGLDLQPDRWLPCAVYSSEPIPAARVTRI
jgi:hypothetical protein